MRSTIHNLLILGIFPIPEIRTGGHRRFLELMKGFAGRGYDVRLLHNPKVRGTEEPLPGRSIPIFDSAGGGPAWLRYLKAVKSRHAYIAEEAIGKRAVVVAFSPTDYFAARALSRRLDGSLLFAFRSNIVTIHRRFGMLHKESRRFKRLQRFTQGIWKRFLEWRICRGSDRLVFQSDFDRDEIVGRNRCAAKKSVIIPNSMQASWFPPELAQTNRSERLRNIVFLGAIGERKGVQFLIPAMRVLCKDRGFNARLDIIGFGGLTEWVQDYVNEHDLLDCVRLVGRDTKPLRRLAQADLLVVPSLYDSFPNSVLEALYVGTPVIGSNTSGVKAILSAPELLFTPASTGAIVEALDRLLSDGEQYLYIKKLCEERRGYFDFDWVGRFEEIVHQVHC